MSLFLTRRFFVVAFSLVFVFLLGYVSTTVFLIARMLFFLCVALVIADIAILYFVRPSRMKAERVCASRFSNGDPNEVTLRLTNPYWFPAHVEVIDEVPIEFQMRDFLLRTVLKSGEESTLTYSLRPTQRGSYRFDRIRLFFASPLGLVQRRYTRGEKTTVKVYPSFARLSLYELICRHRLDEYGIKRMRQVGADTDFEQIKDYVQGDEYRHINWKASARTHALKVNVYQQDRSMQVYSIIDKGRMQQQCAYGMTFLDYAINASLALSYVALRKEDQVGLTAFSKEVDCHVAARKQGKQIEVLMDTLYAQQTIFAESDYSALATQFTQKVSKRSLVILFANFATKNALLRELPYLRQIRGHHQLVVVVFRDREMDEFLAREARDVEAYYQQLSVESYAAEKQQIIRTLRQNDILTIHTYPEDLSVSVINRYLEIRRF